MAAAYQQELIENSMEVQERERAHIAANLHDDLIGQLYAIRLQNRNKELNGLLTRSIQTARSISHDLCPPMIEELSMTELIRGLAEGYESEYKVRLQLEVRSSEPQEVRNKLQLYRVMQEVLTNVHKHASATEIGIFYRHSQRYISLCVYDNGTGLGSLGTLGLGMKNIELRAQLLEAQYRFGQNRPSGTVFTFRMKTTNRQNHA